MWLSALLLVALPTVIAACGPLVIRRFFPVESVAANNEVAGFKFATLGVVYAVILGLAVISVWEKFAEAESAATREASAVTSLYRLATGTDAAEADALRTSLAAYARSAIDDDWPAMANGAESPRTFAALNSLYSTAMASGPAHNDAVFSAMLDQLDLVTDARRARLALAEGVVPSLVWLVLLLGAVITVGFTFFFGLGNLRVQSLMTAMLAFVIFLALYVALEIDHPFSGPISVEPEGLRHVLRNFDPTGG
jgi:hypothetical protein